MRLICFCGVFCRASRDQPVRRALDLLKRTFSEWSEDNGPRLGAALSFYCVFSIPPFLVVVIAVAGFFFGQTAAQRQLVDQVGSIAGPETAEFVQTMISGARSHRSSVAAGLVAVVTLLVGSSAVFVELQQALNEIWDVPPSRVQSFVRSLKGRLLSFLMVLGIGLVLLFSLMLTAALTAFHDRISNVIALSPVIVEAMHQCILIVLLAIIFAAIFKILPDCHTRWRDVWMGAVLTALMFEVGKFLLAFYIGRSHVASTYGAASSIVVVLTWVYYSAQLILFGAEFVQVYSRQAASARQPDRAGHIQGINS